MSTLAALIIGVLIGWVIEWIIDWVYWRRKQPTGQPEELEKCRVRVSDLELEIASYRNQLATLQAEQLKVEPARSVGIATEQAANRSAPAILETAAGNLESVPGVTAEMARRLRAAGIDTSARLGALRPAELKEILGGQIPQPGGEVEMIKQARLTSGMIQKVDDLEVIIGIGPVIARTLNQAGIFTFAELGELAEAELRAIVGKQIQRLADEAEILSQARQLAEKEKRGG